MPKRIRISETFLSEVSFSDVLPRRAPFIVKEEKKKEKSRRGKKDVRWKKLLEATCRPIRSVLLINKRLSARLPDTSSLRVRSTRPDRCLLAGGLFIRESRPSVSRPSPRRQREKRCPFPDQFHPFAYIRIYIYACRVRFLK